MPAYHNKTMGWCLPYPAWRRLAAIAALCVAMLLTVAETPAHATASPFPLDQAAHDATDLRAQPDLYARLMSVIDSPEHREWVQQLTAGSSSEEWQQAVSSDSLTSLLGELSAATEPGNVEADPPIPMLTPECQAALDNLAEVGANEALGGGGGGQSSESDLCNISSQEVLLP